MCVNIWQVGTAGLRCRLGGPLSLEDRTKTIGEAHRRVRPPAGTPLVWRRRHDEDRLIRSMAPRRLPTRASRRSRGRRSREHPCSRGRVEGTPAPAPCSGLPRSRIRPATVGRARSLSARTAGRSSPTRSTHPGRACAAAGPRSRRRRAGRSARGVRTMPSVPTRRRPRGRCLAGRPRRSWRLDADRSDARPRTHA
jgi:hypothetical protein